jgi:hypothetical protein
MRKTLSLINQLRTTHFKLASDLQLCLLLKIRGASDTKKLPKFGFVQSSMPFGDVARH